MLHPRSWISASLFGLVALVPRAEARAQVVSITPTFQASVRRFDHDFPSSDYTAWGIMVGAERPGSWWSPHVWLQRYRTTSDRWWGDGLPSRSHMDGWLLSVGPGILFLRSKHWTGLFLPEVAMDMRALRSKDLKGGAGVHVGFRAGFFHPQVLFRTQNLGAGWFQTVGVGLSVDLSWPRARGLSRE